MAYQFVSNAPFALKLMGMEGTRQWLLQAMDIYDKEGLYPGSAAFSNIEQFAREYRLSHITVTLEQVQAILETIICGLAGRPLKIEAGNHIFTDTSTLYLPAAINRFNDREKNYQLYKVMAVHLWAQTWFGTFRRPSPDSPHLSEMLIEFNDDGRALRLFNLLETYRLNACIERELPGLAREMGTLSPPASVHDATWEAVIAKLTQKEATVIDTLQATTDLYPLQLPWPEPFLYQTGYNLEATEHTMEQRAELEKSELQLALHELIESLLNESNPDSEQLQIDPSDLEANSNEEGTPELTLDGESLSLPPDLENLLSSLLQDFDDIPDDWLVPAEDGDYPAEDKKRQRRSLQRKLS